MADGRPARSPPQPRASAALRAGGFWAVAYAFAVTMASTTLPSPLYPIYERHFGFSALTVTVIFAVYAFGVVAALLTFGELSDQVGRRPVLLGALAFAIVALVTLLVADGLGVLLVGRVLQGMAAGLMTGTGTAALVDLAPDGRRDFATAVAVVVNIGGLGCGTLLSGALAAWATDPLRLPYVVVLALLAPAVLGVLATRDLVRERRRPRLRLQRLSVPREVRGVFVRGALAGGSAFAVSGLVSAVGPSALGELLGFHSPALAGFVIFVLFGASAAGQVVVRTITPESGLRAGCGLLAVGAGLLIAALAAESLALLLFGAATIGAGQGIAVGSGLAAVNERTPPERRGETASSFFVVLYIGLAVPVIAAGLGTEATGVRTTGIIYGAAAAAIALGVLASLMRRRV
jgi:MFS family permease